MNTTYGVPHTVQEKCWALEHISVTTVGTCGSSADEILWVTDSVTNLTFSLAEVPVLFKDLSWSSELSWAMLQKNLG